MAIVRDVLRVNIVLLGLGLLRDAESIAAFSDAVASDVLLDEDGLIIGVPSGSGDSQEGVELPREQIGIGLLPDRTIFEREFPTKHSLHHLADVFESATQASPRKQGALNACGYNLELVYEQTSGDPSLKYLANRLFSPSMSVPADLSLVGATGQLFFDSSVGRWAIRVEPRFNDSSSSRVFMSANLHRVETAMPSSTDMLQSLETFWERVHHMVAQFDGGQ